MTTGRNAAARRVVIYKQPADLTALTGQYLQTHVLIASKIPRLRKDEVSRGPVTVVAGPSDVAVKFECVVRDRLSSRGRFDPNMKEEPR